MHQYYYRGSEEDELIIQVSDYHVSVRATEENDNATALVILPLEEIDRMIAGLQAVKRKIADNLARKR